MTKRTFVLYNGMWDAEGKGENMITYELTLQGQNLLGADKFSIAAESNESVQLRFHFDRSWRIFESKAAVFRDSLHRYYVLDIPSCCVTVPWEVLRDDSGFDLAVVAYNGTSTVYTSKRVNICVSVSLLPEFCRQLSPTETLFDRFKAEAQNRALLEFNDEIRELNEVHAAEIRALGEQLEAERQNTQLVTLQKNLEIAELNRQAQEAAVQHSAEIAELEAHIADNADKAEKWDLIDTAISHKTNLSFQLWNGGNTEFELPMLNLPLPTTLSNTYISSNLTKVGLNLPSATSLQELFNGKNKLREVVIKNNSNVTSCYSLFNGCYSLIYADIGDLSRCNDISYAFRNCSSLRKIKLKNAVRLAVLTSAFSNCTSLIEIDGVLNTMLCNNYQSAFAGCANLETIRFAENCIRANIDFSSCVSLTGESLLSIANGLNDEETATVTLSRAPFISVLSEGEKAEILGIITGKGWNYSLS